MDTLWAFHSADNGVNCSVKLSFPPASFEMRSVSQLHGFVQHGGQFLRRVIRIPLGYYSSLDEFRNLVKRRLMSSQGIGK
ncbi:hypothetical protein TNCV_4091461 [Trichonephila clavipes]|nr:hypothetical protein TNCV_4091461 [Trichonephila clavipes]